MNVCLFSFCVYIYIYYKTTKFHVQSTTALYLYSQTLTLINNQSYNVSDIYDIM